jgi:antitoxin (DNA-binding transcriptional repressor) of toxin-antitoxin stability system
MLAELGCATLIAGRKPMTAIIDAADITLAELLDKLQIGDTFLITNGAAKTPVARIEALPPPNPNPKRLGALEHLNLTIPDSFFFDPLPEEELRMWEEGDPDDPLYTGKPR